MTLMAFAAVAGLQAEAMDVQAEWLKSALSTADAAGAAMMCKV